MNELEKIRNNTNGETPNVPYEILRVENIGNAAEVLENFKAALIGISNNPSLSPESKEWEKILPIQLVEIATNFEYDDFKKDELVFEIDSIIDDMRDTAIKRWEWYSSKLYSDGFEIIFTGRFHLRFSWFIRFQGILASKISIEADDVNYPLTNQIRHDVVEYKKLYLK